LAIINALTAENSDARWLSSMTA